MENLTNIEQNLVLNSLNERYNKVCSQLQEPQNLGDIEKKFLEQEKPQLLELIKKWERFMDYQF